MILPFVFCIAVEFYFCSILLQIKSREIKETINFYAVKYRVETIAAIGAVRLRRIFFKHARRGINQFRTGGAGNFLNYIGLHRENRITW